MKTDNWIYDYIYDLVEVKYISKEKAIDYANNFYNKGKLSEEEYKDLMLFIELTYAEV
ncbi:hypothetical protein [Clostridium butyricum]